MTRSDENLATFVAELRTVTPSAGESLVTESLRSQGYHVSRKEYVRLCIHQTLLEVLCDGLELQHIGIHFLLQAPTLYGT